MKIVYTQRMLAIGGCGLPSIQVKLIMSKLLMSLITARSGLTELSMQQISLSAPPCGSNWDLNSSNLKSSTASRKEIFEKFKDISDEALADVVKTILSSYGNASSKKSDPKKHKTIKIKNSGMKETKAGKR